MAEANSANLTHLDNPDELLIDHKNFSLAREGDGKRDELVHAKPVELSSSPTHLLTKRFKDISAATDKVGKLTNHYRMPKQATLSSTEDNVAFLSRHPSIQATATFNEISVVPAQQSKGEPSDSEPAETHEAPGR